MADKCRVKIIQPTRIVLDSECDHIIIPGEEGDFGVSLHHTPVIAKIRPGSLIIYKDNKMVTYAIHDGFATVENNVVRIVCEVIENAEEIDTERAAKAQDRAKQRLSAPKEQEIDYRRAEAALKRALVRIEIAQD